MNALPIAAVLGGSAPLKGLAMGPRQGGSVSAVSLRTSGPGCTILTTAVPVSRYNRGPPYGKRSPRVFAGLPATLWH